MKKIRLFVLLLVVAACSTDAPEIDSRAYINDLVDIMEENSVFKKSIDWTAFRNDVIAKLNSAGDLNTTIKYALEKLGDPQSVVIRNGGDYIFGVITNACEGTSGGSTDDPTIGYLKVPGNSSNDNSAAIDLQRQIQLQDSENIKGWIVDLRANTGGNFWSMLAGVGPILGEGLAGYYIDGDGVETTWKYDDGKALAGETTASQVTTPYSLINANPKVAVLLGGSTFSAGEGIAIAFVGREHTTSFGSGTCGFPTSVYGQSLSDDGIFYLTIARMADRNKNVFPSSITPDVLVDGDQEIIDKAIEWINQP